MLINCGVGEDSWEFLEQQDQTSQSWRKSTLNIHWKEWCWSWTPIHWPPHVKCQLTGKHRDAGKDRGQEEKRVTESGKTAGWHHWLNGHEFEQTQGMVKGRKAWRAAVHAVAKSRTQLGQLNNNDNNTKTWFLMSGSLQQVMSSDKWLAIRIQCDNCPWEQIARALELNFGADRDVFFGLYRRYILKGKFLSYGGGKGHLKIWRGSERWKESQQNYRLCRESRVGRPRGQEII